MTSEAESLVSEVRGLRQELEVLTEQVQQALAALAQAANTPLPSSADERPVIGCRRAAEVLGVGREQIRRQIGELPPRDPRRPATVSVRGGRMAPWWASREACVTWWADLHSGERPEAPRRRRASRRATASRDGRSLAERLGELAP